MSRIGPRKVEIVVTSASLDEPERLRVAFTPAVQYAVKALRLHCATCGDGDVEVVNATAAVDTEDEALEAIASWIGGTADEIDELLADFKARKSREA